MKKNFLYFLLINFFQRNILLILANEERNSFNISTCCSMNKNEDIFLSCSSNQLIQLNLVEIFYNSNEYCSFQSSSCCQMKTSCSRRITKYYHSICHQKQFCFINKTCLKIYSSCSHPNGLYGQFISINYSCLNKHQTNEQDEDEDEEEEEELNPIIVKLTTSDRRKELIKIDEKSDLKSVQIYLIILIIIFVVLMFFIYYLADLIGKKSCRKKTSEQISSHFIYLNQTNEKFNVQSNNSNIKTRIYPKEIHSYYPYQTLINVQHDPITGQIFSTTFYPHFNYH